jgi:hypothetical protein
MVNPGSIPEQFSYLVVKPLKLSMDNENSIYNVIVIDAIDECSTSWKVESLIKAILGSVTDIPLKFVITSRLKDWINRSFHQIAAPSVQELSLHTVDDVQRDITTNLKSSLSRIPDRRGYSQHDSYWAISPKSVSLPPSLSLKVLSEVVTYALSGDDCKQEVGPRSLLTTVDGGMSLLIVSSVISDVSARR